MAKGVEDALSQLAAQHRAILEQHERWLAEAAAATSVQGLMEENRRLKHELATLKTFFGQKYMHKKPPIPCLPGSPKTSDGDPPMPRAQPPVLEPVSKSSKDPRPKRSSSCPESSDLSAKVQPPTASLQASTCSPSQSASLCDGVIGEKSNFLPGMITSEAWDRSDLQPQSPSSNPIRKSSVAMTKQQLALKDSKEGARELRRLRIILGLDVKSEEVSIGDIAACLSSRMKSKVMTIYRVEQTLRTLDHCREKLSDKIPELSDPLLFADSMVSLEGLIQLRGPHTSELVDLCPPEAHEDACLIVEAFNITMLDEILLEATKTTPAQKHTVTSIVKEARDNYIFSLNIAVVCMVVCNVFSLGAKIDHSPDHTGWFALEILCCIVFVLEAVLKMHWKGIKEYFTGEAKYWNMMDLFITFISLTELSFSIYSMVTPDAMATEGSNISTAARAAVIVRGLRVARIFSLMKLLHSPILRDLANMLVGIVIGIPSLLWVMVFFVFILYLLGLVFRMSLGPLQGQDLIGSGCGYGDDYNEFSDEVCKVHYLYGEEFFGTIAMSMFTVFRFMLGDYSTRGGKSLVVAFSAGYGVPFDTIFVSFMILVIFGLFNIITAIFVDSTISGLKHNDIKRKYARQYEAAYVRTKLKSLMERVWHIHGARNPDSHASVMSCSDDVSKFIIVEEEFIEIMNDAIIQDILADLDISMYNPATIFDTFDPDGNGQVTVEEFIQAIIKLRGEPQKNDIIACFVALRSMQDKLDSMS